MSRSYVGAVGPKCCAMAERDGCLSPSAERAWSRSHSKSVIQRSASPSVKGVGQGRPDRTGVGPTQQPSLTVRQDAHANATLLL